MTNKTEFKSCAIRARLNLLSWYDATHRVLPWRHVSEDVQDPYPIWVSEIMLQQTTVGTVGPYFQRFMEAWPTVDALASAPLDAVLTAWQGLGYYHRARNLHKTAQAITTTYGGIWPTTVAALEKLPGIGAYTAKAIAAIAFQQAVTPVDGNIKRVMARLHGLTTPLERIQKEIDNVLIAYTQHHRPGDFAHALMDLGSNVCTPKKPACMACPLQAHCVAYHRGLTDTLPLVTRKAPKPKRYTAAFVLIHENQLLLRQRPERGLLPHMMEVPNTPWREASASNSPPMEDEPNQTPIQEKMKKLSFSVIHTFTHFTLEVSVYGLVLEKKPCIEGEWVALDALFTKPIPTLMKKIIEPALKELRQFEEGRP